MKTLTLSLPDLAFAEAARQAVGHNVPVEGLCSSILADHFLSSSGHHPPERTRRIVSARVGNGNGAMEPAQLDVASVYADAHPGSIVLAQHFLQEVSKFPDVTVFKSGRKIGFRPNFVFVEYLTQREPGLAVSFYGEPHRHTNPPPCLVNGRRSYSRAKVSNREELDSILPHVAQSYDLKFGTSSVEYI